MKSIRTYVLAPFLLALLALPVSADDLADKADKTGTNPINFQNEFRVYNEYTSLNTLGDGQQNVTTVEMRFPIVGGKWQYRFRGRFNKLSADFDNDGSNDVNTSGMGDFDMRFLTVPYLNTDNGTAFAYALEVFVGGEDEFGSFNTALGPQAFYVKFLKPGFGVGPYSGGGLFAPGIQYKFDLDKDLGDTDTEQILIDLNFLLMGNDKSFWFFTDPQIVIDNEADTEYGIIDFEFGWMSAKWWPELKGHSFYVRPSIGAGNDRPTDWAVEVGYKIVGF